ncbi:thiamine pyrophosphate-dependent dehydrogenase E1 component subunit alpha [Amycolatopsis acidicola]|uniref:Thiamine pyrophosphate-dependent dehydrogenase E1 component subunit alpha n=2 Tax=Amycolatopsis acidicola TaxID=2596893 RepID=A0A5N0UYN6_9PSEU|nr:thiamine pyrophosphate-dependent dehydrogenase E1 component subunit alpha [Amycolatopsis acidicola]
MQRVRLFEEATIALFHAGELPAMVHLSIGQEAAVVGACLATETSDYMTGNHRSHGHPIAKGANLDGLMAELLGKAGGVCGGKGGSMHLADFSVGSLGESGIVGSAIPVATGAALAAQVRRSGQVSLCFFGDGAASEGVLHESMNMASIWRLPVIYFCENNGYAVSVTSAESLSVPDVAMRAAGYSMPGVVVDGQDVLAVFRATTEAVRRARAGEGPSLVEAKTYRFHEHAYGLVVPQPYRDQQVVDSWFDTVDPITLFHDKLVGWGVLTADELRSLHEEVKSEVDASVEFARRSPFPPPEAAYTDLYSEVTA